jgi:cytoskeletal protein CcmA (bactofilin family)
VAEAACVISKGIQVRGNLSGSGDLVVQGRMEGHVALPAHITIEAGGVMVADVDTEDLTVEGEVSGNAGATGLISIASSAVYVGDLRAPRIVLEDGARFRGKIEMDVPLPKDI